MRATRRLVQLTVGLILYGVSMAFMVESRLGLNPWDVFHQGLSKVTGLSFGLVVILLGIPILLLWIPLRQRPGGNGSSSREQNRGENRAKEKVAPEDAAGSLH